MANESYSLKIGRGGTTKELYTDYKAVVLEGTQRPGELETANVTTQEWYGEGGEDVYIPRNGIVFKAYDWKVKMGIKANSKALVKQYYDALVNGLKQGVMTITDGYSGAVMNGCYLKSVSQDECMLNDSGESFMVFDVVFRVTEN